MKHPDPRQELRRRRRVGARYDYTINLCVGGAIVMAVMSRLGVWSIEARTVLQLLAGGCWLLACGTLARKRDRSFWWGILGVFPVPIVGAVLIMALPRGEGAGHGEDVPEGTRS